MNSIKDINQQYCNTCDQCINTEEKFYGVCNSCNGLKCTDCYNKTQTTRLFKILPFSFYYYYCEPCFNRLDVKYIKINDCGNKSTLMIKPSLNFEKSKTILIGDLNSNVSVYKKEDNQYILTIDNESHHLDRECLISYLGKFFDYNEYQMDYYINNE